MHILSYACTVTVMPTKGTHSTDKQPLGVCALTYKGQSVEAMKT